MQQLIVECSDPGVVISLAEEFEHVLRQIDFTRVQALQSQLTRLAHELGGELEAAWRGFRIETPNDSTRPPAFGNRDPVDESQLKQFLTHAAERGIGRFEVSDTLLLPQHGPALETRDQYVSDLADAIRSASRDELAIVQRPVELPTAMADYRQHMMDEYPAEELRARAKHPTVGHGWIEDSLQQLEKALGQVNTRSEAVMIYELGRLTPGDMERLERIRWAALAARLGTHAEKWAEAAAESMQFIYQRASLAWLLWTECRGWGDARPFLEKQFESLIEQARSVYTADAVEALEVVYADLRRPLWAGLIGAVGMPKGETNAQ